MMRRMLRRPAYVLSVYLILALAITANAAVFSIVYGLFFQPLPYAQPHQLMVIRERLPKVGQNLPHVSVKTYLAIKRDVKGIDITGLAKPSENLIVDVSGQQRLLNTRAVTPSLLKTLGREPVVGRLPSKKAAKLGGPNEVVISYHLWQSLWGGNRSVLEDHLRINDTFYQIVGVMPKGFFYKTHSTDVWLPLVITPELVQSTSISYFMLARLRRGVSRHRLNMELRAEGKKAIGNCSA